MRLPPLFLLCLAPVPSCSGGESAGDLPAEVAALVPADAVAIVRMESFDDLALRVARLRELMDTDGEDFTAETLARATLGAIGMEEAAATALDTSRALAFALRLDPAATPPFSLLALLPAADPDRLTEQLRSSGVATRSEAGYVAAWLDGAPPDSADGSRLLAGLPDGIVSARVDAGALYASFGIMIGFALNAAESSIEEEMAAEGSPGSAEILAPIFSFVRKAVSSADLLDVSLGVDDDGYSLALALTLKAGSPAAAFAHAPAPDWIAQCRRLDPEAHFAFLASAEFGALLKFYASFYDDLADEFAAHAEDPQVASAEMRRFFAEMRKAYSGLGRSLAGSGTFAPDGVRGCWSAAAADPAGAATAFISLMHAPGMEALGMRGTEPAAVTIAGLSGSAWEMEWDLATLSQLASTGQDPRVAEAAAKTMTALYGGKNGARFAVLAGDGAVHMLIGGDDRQREAMVRRATAGGSVPDAWLRLARELEGADPGGLLWVDGRPVIETVLSAMAASESPGMDAEEIAAGIRRSGDARAPFAIYWGASARDLRAGLRCDVEGWLRILAAMSPR